MSNQPAMTLKTKAVRDLEAGKFPQALKKAQLGVKKFPKDPDFPNIAGFVLTEMKQYKKSVPHFAQAARIRPDHAEYAENLANALMQSGELARALSYAEQKAEKFPASSELARVLDELQLKSSDWHEAIRSATEKLATDPDNPDLLSIRGKAYGKIGYVDQYFADVSRAFELDPDSARNAVRMASALHQRGDKAGSARLLRRVLETESSNIAALYQLSSMVDKADAPALLANVETVISEQPDAKSELEFAKAQLISKLGGVEAALAQFAKANATQHAANPYSPADQEADLKRTMAVFPIGQPLPNAGREEEPAPIFVVGQPRSGTTLMEMMLSAGTHVAGCGELTLFADLVRPLLKEGRHFDDAVARDMAREFREQMPPLPEGTRAFVDKMPHNYQRVGFMLAAFPNARVINMLRDPRDVGLSKWIRCFPASGMNYASDQSAIAHSANMYRRYMAHWGKVCGDRIMTVQYEKLVADPETLGRRVADFCGIAWEEGMAHPERNTGVVRTASIDQVRSKISAKSVGGWRDVAEHLRPMLDGFDPALWPEYDLEASAQPVS